MVIPYLSRRTGVTSNNFQDLTEPSRRLCTSTRPGNTQAKRTVRKAIDQNPARSSIRERGEIHALLESIEDMTRSAPLRTWWERVTARKLMGVL